MIRVMVGRPGMGKTVWLVSQIIKYAKDYDVYTNVEVKLPKNDKRAGRIFYIEGLEDCINLRSGKIILDEVQTYLNSREWAKLDVKFQLFLQQHRKRGLDIIGATQSIKRADGVFRELVQQFYEIKKIVSVRIGRGGIGFYIIREYDPDSIESSTRSYDPIGWYTPFIADPFLYRVYDTTQEYRRRDPAGRREMVVYGFVPHTAYRRVVVDKKTLENASEGAADGEEAAIEAAGYADRPQT